MDSSTSIKKQIIKGSIWIAIAKYSGIIIQIIITAILARLITPAAFGTIAVAMVILQFLNVLSDIGIGPAIVQYKLLSKKHLNSLFSLNIYIGIALSILLFFLSGVIADYYNDISLVHICKIMALVIFFNSLNVVPNALMRKDKRFNTIAKRTLSFQVLSGLMAIWGAYNGWGIYALLVSPLLTSFGVFCVNYYNYPLQYVVRMDKEALTMVSSFSFFQFVFSFFNYFSRNLDKLIIGRYFSMSQLGYYDKSYHLMLLPVQNITFVIEPVLHPVLSSLQTNKNELGFKNISLVKIISRISFPIGIILYFCGAEMIHIVYGNQWNGAIPVFKILALSLPLQMIQSTSGAIYQAAGNTKHMFINGFLNTIITVSGFLIAAIYGKTIEAMAWAWNITLIINFINSYCILNHFTLGCRMTDFFRSLIPQLINSVITFIIVYLITNQIDVKNLFILLLLKVIFVMLFTVVLAKMLRQYDFMNLINYLKK